MACTQERRLFSELVGPDRRGRAAGRAPHPVCGIPETGGWAREAQAATPKMAAAAAAHLPDPGPVPTVACRSQGRLLIMGTLEAAERVAALGS